MKLIRFSEKHTIPTYDDPAQIQPGDVLVDPEKCTGCLLCVKLCPANALVAENKSPVIRPAGQNECMACGDCMAFCTEKAIVVSRSLKVTGRYKTIDHGELRLPQLM
jgi:ferredoxin